jgi:DNA-binding transcriptional regulator GbsR (MarR family)
MPAMASGSNTSPSSLTLTDTQLAFIEKLSAFSKQVGLSKSIFRVLGLLAVCQPPEQSAQNIQTALNLSAGSVSMAMTFLTKMKLVERVKLPNDRQYYYMLAPDGFEKAFEQRLGIVVQARKLIDDALTNDPENPRLSKWRDFYAFNEAELRSVIFKMKADGEQQKP